MKGIYKIVFIGDPMTITKKDGTSCYKQSITLQEMGGKYEDQYAATLLSDRICQLPEGSYIMGALRCTVRTHEGLNYQDILLTDFLPLTSNPSPFTSHPSPATLPILPTIPTL